MTKKRLAIFILTFLAFIPVSAKKVYLIPNDWTSDNAALFVHSWGSGSDIAGKMTKVSANLYEYEIGSNNKCLFVRQNTSLGDNIDWNQKWNQTADLDIPSGKNCYTITGWGANDGSWGTYDAGTPEPDPIPTTYYVTGTADLVGADKAWDAAAVQLTESAGLHTHTFGELAADVQYKLKVTNGTWAQNWGYTALKDIPTGVTNDTDGNIVFTLASVGNVTVSFDGTNITLVGDFSAQTTDPTPGVTKTIYLNTGGTGLWNTDNAKFFVHSWNETGHADLQMMLHEADVYKVSIPEDHNSIIFLRLAPEATQVVWEGDLFWNKTADLTIPASKDCYAIRGWGEYLGSWILYGVEPYPGPLYGSSVPGNCPDVMLQAFYWDSNQDKYYGNTRWKTLQSQAQEISSYFDLVWLPPSAMSSGGVGYLPKQYSNQNCDWGSKSDLRTLIQQLHDGGAKVVADMVVNHIDGKDGWCSFYEQDFGQYGKFQIDGSYICNGDEMNWDADEYCRGKATGPADDGYGGESNYGAARDLAHDSEKVREMIRAYAQWMISEMHYDGFRYDYCKGFHMSHVNDYNANSGAYFSVLEYWDGNADVLWERIADASENTLAFDFATKYSALNEGIAQGNYAKCMAPGLLGKGKGKWAVTFIDNHDTFERGNGSDFGGDSMSESMKHHLLEANAFILSMPGIPCIFYPHWVKYGKEIKDMILARKAMGVHSESAVSDEIVGNGYRAYVTGTKGILLLELGDAVSQSQWGYSLAASGAGYRMWVTYGAARPELTVHTKSTTYRTATLAVTMSAVGLGGTPTIYYTLDGTDPRSSVSKKTYSGEISISGTVTLKAYAELNGDQSDLQTYTYTYLPPQEAPITICFKKPTDWEEAYLYTWTANNELPTGAWPGMLLEDLNAGGFYYHTIHNTDAREINFIFNNGSGEQSQDLLTYEDACYAWESNKAVPITCYQGGGTTTEVENMQSVEKPQLTLSMPMYNVLGQRVDASYHGIVIQNGHKYIR